MIASCKLNNLGMLKTSKFFGGNMEAKDKNGATCFIIVCKRGYAKIVHFLIQNGVNKEAKDAFERTGFEYLFDHGRFEIIDLLIKSGMNMESKHLTVGFMTACEKGHVNVVDLLIKSGLNMDVKTHHGMNGFFCACKADQTKIVHLLIKSGLNMNIDTQNIYFQNFFSTLMNKILNPNTDFDSVFEQNCEVLIAFMELYNLKKLPPFGGFICGSKNSENFQKLKQQFEKKIKQYQIVNYFIKDRWSGFDTIANTICNFTNGQNKLEKILEKHVLFYSISKKNKFWKQL